MNIKELTKQKESEALEFKSSLGELREIIETVTDFANTKGGKIVIGVSNNLKNLATHHGDKGRSIYCIVGG